MGNHYFAVMSDEEYGHPDLGYIPRKLQQFDDEDEDFVAEEEWRRYQKYLRANGHPSAIVKFDEIWLNGHQGEF